MSEILYIPDIARMLGTTEAGVRAYIQRKRWDALPPCNKRGGRWAWYRRDVERWLEGFSSRKKKRGRPTKAEQINRAAVQGQTP